jgi:hypothetical protein
MIGLVLLAAFPLIAQAVGLSGKCVFGGAGYDSSRLTNTNGVIGLVNPANDWFSLYRSDQISAIPGTTIKSIQPSSLHFALKAGPIIRVLKINNRKSWTPAIHCSLFVLLLFLFNPSLRLG